MPQLNPHPWFLILIFSWFIMLAIIPPKILSHKFPNNPDSQVVKTPKTLPWNWKWH
ncbi:ATP synthase F0 subunit 8 (mitochondrion) [Syngnathoides biaculeatus]|uniref:ATP synthase complex subunit 8 n=1 Tax=Syngnathoides biaculeatus TaxID=300417 RepID=A0A342CFV0_9TELE|nr:ATP synthase F0 subunit 8 [Syngnathoides biaculeatus]AHN95947.1 ATPase subunit 8 [Syngnathoides biaculeatus]AWI49230.1 ATPase subunit 8 [Syngnathoides biaculeatus]